MAPSNGKGSKARSTGSSVVPAIPLPYLHRRNAKSISSKPEPGSPLSARVQSDVPNEPTSTPKVKAKKPAAEEPVAESVTNGLSTVDVAAEAVNGATNGQANDKEPQTTETSSVNSSEHTSPNFDRPAATPSQSDSSNVNSGDEMLSQDVAPNGDAHQESRQAPAGMDDGLLYQGASFNAAVPSAHAPHVLAQPTTVPSLMRAPGYRMPPPFHPQANPPDVHQPEGLPLRPRLPNHHAPNHIFTHHPQPSNSSVQFGGFHGSNASSPAPHSSGFAPPPSGPMPNGRPAHAPRGPGDMPPGPMPYGEFEPTTTMGPYGQGMMSHGGPDGYGPYTNYGPPTPHSFHGSQSSAHADENGAFGQYSPVPGGKALGDELPSRAHLDMPPPIRMVPAMPPPHLMHPMMDPDASEFFAGMRRHYQNPKLSDCTLEIKFLDDRHMPLKIPAHRVVLAQSKPLDRLMTKRYNANVVLTVDNKYVRLDSLSLAMQRLYGFPLFSIPTPPPGSEELELAGTETDRFDFILGYAASGHVLGLRSVVIRGMEMAVHLLTWETLEKALEFALGPDNARGTIDLHEHWPYEEPTRILLDGIVNFIINNLPSDFVLDTSVSAPEEYARLPLAPSSVKHTVPTPSKSSTQTSSPEPRRRPEIARGTSVHLRGHGDRSRVSKIKFGEFLPDDVADSTATPKAKPKQPAHYVVISRVLLNLPFGFLKAVIEASPFGSEMDEGRRRQLANEVVAEREARRLAAIEVVKAGRLSEVQSARRALSLVEPRATDLWTVLGFQESIIGYGNPLGPPYLCRNWNPMAWEDETAGSSGLGSPVAAYP